MFAAKPCIATWAILLGLLSGCSRPTGDTPAHHDGGRGATQRLAPQHTNSRVAFPEDRILERLEEELPRGWRMVRHSERFVIEGHMHIWVLGESGDPGGPINKINAPFDYWDGLYKRWEAMKRATPPTRPFFSFRYEARWSAEKIAKVVAHNAPLEAEIKRISAKIKGRWKHGWDQRRKATAKFRRKLQVLPYNTERYSLFRLRADGAETSFNAVFPRSATRRIFKMDQRLVKWLRPLEAR